MTSYFYSNLLTPDQKAIAKQYKVNYRVLRSWLRCLTDLRNICAHYGRLYYRIFTASPAGIQLSEDKKRRLWGLMLVMKEIYPDEKQWQVDFLPSLKEVFREYQEFINLNHLAFPKDWFDQLDRTKND